MLYSGIRIRAWQNRSFKGAGKVVSKSSRRGGTAVGTYDKAWLEVFKSGYVKEETIQKHVEHQAKLDMLLPKFSSFFMIVDHSRLSYRFIGEQQQQVSGYTNQEVMSKGVEFFLQSLHPDELPIILTEMYPRYNEIIINTPPEKKTKLLMHDNCRFRCKNGEYINIMQQGFVLEFDRNYLTPVFWH